MARIPVDRTEGVASAKAAEIASAAGLPPQTVDVLLRLWQALVHEGALLVETGARYRCTAAVPTTGVSYRARTPARTSTR
ncbi:hypothetical protein ABT274_36835 [Streptomyces sp. NPDC001127]|uniref:hypothetical protein n=1 Tax=Streptomyces sp. NPDC001127 TaxID=3154377 RepID=UPI00331EBA97